MAGVDEGARGTSGQTSDSKPEQYTYVGVAAVRRSINALKWRHKQLNDKLSERISTVVWNSRRYKEIMEEMVIHRNRYKKLDEKFLLLYELLEGDKTANQDFQNEWKETIKEKDTLEALLDTKLGDFKAEEEPDGGRGRESPEPPPRTQTHTINSMDIKPAELNLGMKSNQFNSWIDSANFYFRICGIGEQGKADQRNFFYTLVSADIKSRMQLDIDEDTTGFKECIDAVKNAFSERNPLITLRWLLMELKQNKDELFLDYLARFRTAWYDAKFDEIEMKDLYNILTVNGITDEMLKSKLSCMEELTMEVIKNKAREHTRKIIIAGENERALETDTPRRRPMSGKCFRCDRTGHPAFRCKATCYCKEHKTNGHKEGSAFCKQAKEKKDNPKKDWGRKSNPRKEWRTRQTDGRSDSGEEYEEAEDSGNTFYEEYNTRETDSKEDAEDTEEFAHQMKVINKNAPYIEICFNEQGKRFKVDSIADTGSSKAIMSTRIANSNNVTIDNKRKIRLFNANGKQMKVEGIAKMKCYPRIINGKLNRSKRKCIDTEFIVSSDLKSDVLLSCSDLKRMGVIPESFPNITIPEESKSYETEETNFECMESKSEENMIGLTYSERKEINDLIKEFDDVLKDNIDDKK